MTEAATSVHHLRRSVSAKARDCRLLLRLAKSAVARPYRPVMAHLIVTRRCNLSCGYCFEYDKVSAPVSFETLKQRIDHLHRLRTAVVTLTGGETLLHPDLVALVAYIRELGMTPAMNTNGYLLTRERILELGDAGLFAMQISIDNLRPNDNTMKSLKTLRPKLELLAEHAVFRVRINTVLGTGSPQEAVQVARAVTELGFDAKCSLVRDQDGAFIPLSAAARDAYQKIRAMRRASSLLFSEGFQTDLIADGEIDWKCRAGARYFHVCENGLVHYCSSNMGAPGTPLQDYGEAHMRRAFHTRKACASTCTQAYAHQASKIDRLRPQRRQPEPRSTRVHLPVVGSQSA